MSKPIIISSEGLKRLVLDEMRRAFGPPPMQQIMTPPFPMPYNQNELLNMLDPQRDEDTSPQAIFSRLGEPERRSLSELAQSIRTAETKEDRYTAVEGLRAALQAYRFPKDWIDMLLEKQKEPPNRMKMKLPEDGKPRYGEPLERNYRDSQCRFYTKAESDADGNQGSFTG